MTRVINHLYRVIYRRVNHAQDDHAALTISNPPDDFGLVADVGPRIAFAAHRESAVTNEVDGGNMPPAGSAVNPKP